MGLSDVPSFTLHEQANLRGTGVGKLHPDLDQEKLNLLRGETIQDLISNEIMHEAVLAKAMTIVFRPDQLVNCSMNGGSTTPKGEIREGLPIAERCAIVDVISKKFALPISTVEEKMRWALRRLCVMNSAENI
ncbi:hypothetical protein DPMN_057945 [Dreissena polymorpha]|uniref:Uncharacterized protein n=1 Tax=Dreissena polymorpha TaxID=45954 RepID=A0A9D4C134_DREPO|nr:hypothetical protein DPMN_057945 [Dreissena polymorpha]